MKQEKKKEEIKKLAPKIKKPALPKPVVKVEEKGQVQIKPVQVKEKSP